ncbi:MAG TPA: 50S ribosomal protein L6 [bacterium]|nr:50S ribosomal protein L6 [bacterium]
MSRVGKQPIKIPNGVSVTLDGVRVKVKGPKGSLERNIPGILSLEIGSQEMSVQRPNDEWTSKSLHGLTRTLVSNMVTGVSTGFSKQLEIQGRGYRASVDGKTLVLDLGFSHQIRYPIPEGMQITTPDPTKIVISGADKEAVGHLAAKIRSFRPPEPYQGKGVRYVGEYVARKAGKKNV